MWHALMHRFEFSLIAWDTTTRFIIGFNGVSNILLGVSVLLWANISAESVLSHFFPPKLWPILWILAGLLGIGGLWSIPLARFSFLLSGVVMAVFTAASLWAVVIDDRWVAIPTTVFLLYISVLLLCIASLIRQRDDILKQVAEVTRVGQDTLDKVQS